MRARYGKKTRREGLVYHADELRRAQDGGAG
jgi:hypothetical protein